MTEGGERPGLRVRIAIVIAVTWFVSVVTIVIYLHWALERSAVVQWQHERHTDAAVLAGDFERSIHEMTGDLRLGASVPSMAGLPAIDRVDPAINGIPPGVDNEKRQVLDALLDDGAFSILFILQPNGDHYLSHPFEVQKALKRFNLADRPYVREVTRTRQPVVSDVFIGADGVAAVAIDIPRLNEAGEIVLHLGGVIHLPRLTELLSKSIPDPYDLGLLVDRNGAVIANSLKSNKAGVAVDQLAAALHQFQLERPEPNQAVTRTFRDLGRGEEVVATFAVLRSGWAVALARGRWTFTSEIRPEITWISIMTGGLLLLIGAIGFALASRMAGHWERARRALAAAHAELEDRVHQRTIDLDLSRQELQVKSTTLETILENISQGISLYDENLRLVACNRRFVELLELPPEMGRPGTPLADYLRYNAERGEYGPCDVDSFVAERVEQARHFQAHRFHRRRGNGMVLDVVGTPLAGGGFVTTHADITEVKRSEEALRTLSRAVEQSPVSVVITNPNGNIEYVNPKFVAVTGYTLEEVAGKTPRILKSGLIPSETYRQLWQTILSGDTWEGDLQNRKKSGDLYWERASISPIRSPDGEITHFLAVKEDITQRKQIETDLLAAWQAADEANRAKTVFLSHMSHELRTPLTAVLGYAEMMEIRIAGPLPPAYADYVDGIISGGRHLLSIIDEVLDISRIELDSYLINAAETDILALAAECVAMLRPQCEAKGIDVQSLDAAPIIITSDERAVRQVLINLLGNATKYTPSGGRITVSVVELAGDQPLVSITVADSGCGIPPEKLGRIFEPFQQVDPLRADPSRGVGLGLAICRRLVGLLGGNISIRSELGVGTIARVTLPLHRPLPLSEAQAGKV